MGDRLAEGLELPACGFQFLLGAKRLWFSLDISLYHRDGLHPDFYPAGLKKGCPKAISPTAPMSVNTSPPDSLEGGRNSL